MKNKIFILMVVPMLTAAMESRGQNTIGVTPIGFGGGSFSNAKNLNTTWGIFYDRNINNSAWTWSTLMTYYRNVRNGTFSSNPQSSEYYRQSNYMLSTGMRYDFLHNRDKKWQLYIEPGLFFENGNFEIKMKTGPNNPYYVGDMQKIHTGFMMRTGVDFNLSSRFTLGYQFSVLMGPLFLKDNTAANPSMNYNKMYLGVPNNGTIRIGYRFK